MNFIDEQIARLKKQQSDPNYVAPNIPYSTQQDDNNYSDSGNWLEAAGIGASNMVNNLALGGFAQLLGTLGRGVEWISPFSGSQADDRVRLMSYGIPYEQAREIYPDEDSWLTSGAKGLLEAQNFIGDKINQWREQSIGDNPSFGTQVAEGVGSSLGFMGAGLLSALASGSPYAGAIISGLTEAMSESGGVLGDAYSQGLYDDGGLAAANKSLAANAVLNGALNTTLGMFSPWTKNIRNPLTRYAAQSGTEVLNEILQEPSQQTIEKAAHDSLHNGGNFMPALGVHVKDWPQDFSKLLPSVAASSLITSLVKGGIDMSSAQNRQLVRDEWRNRMYDPEETAASLRAELDKRQKLLNQLQRTKALTPDNAKSIDDINNQIRNADKNIATYQDRLKPGYLDYIPNPYDEFSGRVSKVTTRAGQNEYNTAFMLAEADDLITSHNDTFSPNPDYNQDWQIRDRSNISSQNEVKRIADNLDPSSLGDNRLAQNGAPIVFQNEDGKNYVISGNGRTLAIRQAYKYNNEGAKNYRKFIIDNAANFGVDPNIAASMKKPVLVRSLLDKNIDLAQFAADANSNTTQQLNATEKSLDYAKKINEKNLMRHFDPDKNISDNSDFLRELYKLTDPAERNNLTYTQGNSQTFSRQFVDDVANALRAVAFGNTHEHILVGKLNQATDDVSRNISNALNKLAPRFAVLNSSGHSDYSIAQELEDAVINLDRYRNNATQDITVEGQDRTLNMFDDLNLTPEARTILDFFLKYGNKPTEILQGLANYAKLASEQTEDGQGTIDGFATKSDKLTLLNRAFGNTSTRQLQQNTQQVTPQKITAPVQQTVQQSNPAQNIQRTATQTTQNTPNATAMSKQQQTQAQTHNQQIPTAKHVFPASSNEAYYGNDYYSDRGGDNSNPEQDIPEGIVPDTGQTAQKHTSKNENGKVLYAIDSNQSMLTNARRRLNPDSKNYQFSVQLHREKSNGRIVPENAKPRSGHFDVEGYGRFYVRPFPVDDGIDDSNTWLIETIHPVKRYDFSHEYILYDVRNDDPVHRTVWTNNDKDKSRADIDMYEAVTDAFWEHIHEFYETSGNNQQDSSNNPQGSRLVHNRQANSYDEEIQQSKSAPDYSESTDTGDLRLYPQQHNARGYTPFDTIGLKHNQFQELNDSDVPQYADISGLTQNTDNQQATQKPQNNSPNLNDYQGLGNLGSNIGNRSNDTNQIQQEQISSEQGNEDNSQLGVPQYVDISALIDTEQNNDENTQPYDNVNRSIFDHQYDSNSQQNLQTLSNNVQDNGNVQNQQERSKSDDYLPPEIIRTKEGNITVQGARVQQSFIPSEHEQIRNAARTGKPMTRYVFAKHGERDTSAPTANNPEKYSYDAKLTGYDGYLGDVTTGAGNYTDTAHAFYGLEDGVHYVGFADDNGNFVATYNMNDNSFFINEGSETSGLARKIEAEFKRQFGHHPTAEIIRRLVMQKAINAGENDSVADAASRIYMAENEYLAAQTGISLLDMAMADNLSIQKINRIGKNNDRGSTKIIPEMGIDGNPVFEAQNVVSLFKNSDASSLIHEFWHIYQEKIKRLGNAGLINEGTNLFDDWKTIRSDAGLLRANFKEGLSPQEYAKWLNSQEKNAASFEKYFREGKPPEGISQKMLAVFNNFKDWLTNIYRKVRDIFYTNANGRRINDFAISDDIRNVFDHILLPHRKVNFNQATEQGQKLNSSSDPQGFQEFRQSGLDPQGWFSQKWHNLKNWAGNLFSSTAKVGLPKSPTDWRSLPFPTQETQQRFMDAMKAAPKLGIIGRMRLTVRDIAASIKGGDYSDITNSTRKNDPQLRLNEALQAFRNLGRSKVAAADKAVTLMTDIIRPLNKKQRELLNTYTVIRDIAEQIDEMPGSPLSFGLSEQDARKMNAQLARMVDEDEKVKDAVKQLDDTRNAQVEEFKKQAHALGLNFDDVFHYKNYFRRRVFQYLEASRAGKHIPSARGNLDIQGRYDGELREIMGHSFFMKRKGTQLDYVTDYVQANAEVRAQLAQDIETMKTLQIIKKNHDIASDLRKQHGIKSQQLEIDYDDSQTFSQSGDEHKSLLDVIPDGYEAFDPSATRLIETAQSAPENLMHMVANDIAEQHGFPLDTLLERLGIQNDGNLMVIPTEIANTLRKMAKSRHRGMLGQAAKDLTTWWKRSVLFTPTRNLLYNIRNFTGDLDALIAGNPKALRHFPRAVRELTGWYTQHGKEGYEASQDLQDYIRLSGTLGIQSLNLSAKDAQAIIDLLPTPETTKNGRKIPVLKHIFMEQSRNNRNAERAQALQEEQDPGKLKKAAGVPLQLIRKFFQTEHDFTEWREHLLRFAAYLEYKNQMESNKDGRPSNWGASIEDEVMSIKDIKERAFKMSNELLGAYDQVSEVGKQLRDMLIPFYSWMEVNMRRTYRLLKNGFKYGYGAQQVKNLGAGKLAAMPLYALSAGQSVAKLMALTMAMQMFNRFVFPDADDDLPNDVKYRPHLTFGSKNGRTYYFDRIGAVADVLDWASLDSAWLDAKDFANGQKSIGSWLKQIAQAPFSKVINGLNPAIKMPIELAMGRSMFPNAFNPSTIRDPAEYVARSFGLAWPYKAARGIPHNNWQEASKFLIYSQDSDEAAYWQTLDRVRQFQNEVLDKHFDGFASTRRGRILANIKKALRYNDRAAVRRFLKEYNDADGSKQGLKSSMNAMNPLHGLNEKEKKQFMKWISADDRKYLRKAERYFHQLADRFLH